MDKSVKVKAALYIRVSTEEQAQDGQSASAQTETLKQYCGAFDIEVADIYEDLGVSGKSLRDRRGLKRLLEDCSRKSFQLVLVWKISRLSRNLKDLLYLIDTFESNNVHFASCSEKFDTSTPVGRMTLQLLGSIAEFERNTIIENVKLGLKEFARKGGKAATLLGYDNIGKQLVINEREAGIVRLIFSLYSNSGMSFSAIAKYLNSLGYRTKRGSEFRSSSIAYVLRNPAYISINRHRMNSGSEYCINGVHPAIIDMETWNKAQGISSKISCNAARKDNNGSLHLKAACARCKTVMRVFYACSKGKKYKYLRCSSCSNYVNYEKLESTVAHALARVVNDRSKWEALCGILCSNPVNEPAAMEIKAVDSDISRLEKSKSRYMELFESYKLSDTKAFIDRIAEIDKRLAVLSRKRLKLIEEAAAFRQPDNDTYFKGLNERLAQLEPSTIEQLAGCLVKTLEVYKGEIKILLYL